MKTITGEKYSFERALYAERDIVLKNCAFKGEEDGESALKEAQNVTASDTLFDLRYPLWHNKHAALDKVTMTGNCRAPIWYSEDIGISESLIEGVKAIRECKEVSLRGCRINSPEFCWKSRGIKAETCEITGEYPFFMSRDIVLKNVTLSGKYSFQYTGNVTVENCNFDTKDAFWHAHNVTVRDTIIKGEYFGWYSEGLTLIGCKIIGTQPLCYCKNLRLIDCEMEEADLSFEYSDVNADIKGEIVSVKNPLSGKITAEYIGEVILTSDSVHKSDCEISIRSC